MAFFSSPAHSKDDTLERPALDLSGPALRAAMEKLAVGCEPSGGVERFVAAVKARGEILRDSLADGAARTLDADRMAALAMFLPTVRRRIGPYLEDDAFTTLKRALETLLGEAHDPAAVDERIAAFCAAFPQDKAHRWVRDLAAEALHAADVERYPLMCRWVWDARANTGALREIWHGDVDRMSIPVSDGYATFVMLREELSQFLSQNGIFRDVLHYVDLVCAQVYADYVAAQGGSYLRADFSSAEDPAAHLRRLLGLDGVRTKTGRLGPADGVNAAAALLEQR